uniref:TTF-type domain-containing protein n=1 Tax=Triticum urartu TaxID=4572 RepID=A0A8R7VFV7_TRIUA
MRRFLVKRARTENMNDVQPEVEVEQRTENVNDAQPEIEVEPPAPNVANEFNPNAIERDPGKRKQICEYPPDIQDQVRRAYILKGPMQPDLNKYHRTEFGSSRSSRAFSKSWYKMYDWIEYSEWKNAAYCFYCFLFKQPGRAEHFGYEVFTKEGFTDWKHASKGFKDHIGGHGSRHNSCVKHYDDYNNQRQSVASNFARSSKES